MFKKHLVFLMLMVMATMGADASTWKIHNAYMTSKQQYIFDTGDKVYYLNSGSLFQFDKATTNTIVMNKQKVLSDNNLISDLFYDWENGLLFVVYANSNIDVIDSNDKVTNISNIKDRMMPLHCYQLTENMPSSYVSKNIRDITFGNGLAYVATGYGYVTINEETLKVEKEIEVKQTVTVNSVCPMGDLLLIFSNARCYYGAPGDPDPINNYTKVSGTFSGCRTYPLDDHSVFVFGSSSSGLQRYDFSGETPTLNQVLASSVRISNVQKSPSGFIGNFTSNVSTAGYYQINAAGTSASKKLSGVVRASSHPNGDGTIWVTDLNGLHISGNTTYYKINTMTTAAPYWLKYNAAMDKLYVGVSGANIFVYSDYTVANVINTYDGMNWADATAYTAAGAGYEFVFNPLDPHTYLRSSWNKGIFKVTDDVKTQNYTTSNSKFGSFKPAPAFDKYGNLWVVTSYPIISTPAVVLPKNKALETTVTKNDWFQPTGVTAVATGTMQRAKLIISTKNNVKIFSDCDFIKQTGQGYLYCWDNFNEDPLVDEYRFVNLANFIDQNNNQVTWEYLSHFEEDKEGLIWVGHTSGLFVLDPDEVFNETPHVVRPFFNNSSEGKGYLCEGYSVSDIGVDRDNNKWIATNEGLYFVSPDGSEIYNHFTTKNSDIPSNNVYSVECDTVHDRVYIFTDNAFAEYYPYGDAAATSFDNVFAFPNPVEPDFTGLVKITNLMEDSFVTITDRLGNVVAEFGPVMGSAFWDTSDASGERVPTGVYNIYAAQGSQPVTSGTPQATVMIIK